jgi:hypothetical protein
MDPVKFSRRFVFVIALIILALISACNMPEIGTSNGTSFMTETVMAFNTMLASTEQALLGTLTPEPVSTASPQGQTDAETPSEPSVTATEIVHLMTPSEPGWISRWFQDTNSSVSAGQGIVYAGDDFSRNLYERPFTRTDMQYRPDLDILKAEIASDGNFFYILITLQGPHSGNNGFPAAYSVELDTDLDGRGDYLVIAENLASTTWTIQGVSAFSDPNNDVGGFKPILSESSNLANGYEQILFDLDHLQDPDAAWARISTSNPNQVQLAFKRSMVGNPARFLWGVWSDDGVKDPALYDYNDHFTLSDAGSPYQGTYYPLKALHSLDNTCREVFGFTPTGEIPGLCLVPPTPTPSPTPTITRTTTLTPALTGSLTGKVFIDNNKNGSQDSGEPGWGSDLTVTIGGGTCASPDGTGTGLAVDANGNFGIGNRNPGNYCVSISTSYTLTTPDKVNITIPPGGSQHVIFGLETLY